MNNLSQLSFPKKPRTYFLIFILGLAALFYSGCERYVPTSAYAPNGKSPANFSNPSIKGALSNIEAAQQESNQFRPLASKLDGDGKHVARLAFAGGAFTPPLTKGRYAPLETQLIRTDSSPPQADGAFSGSS